ncbi:MAG TPA: heavy-metal-associated domain-containing protein [Allosphingosinicella sp.]|jgi:copper chaperone
MINFNVPGMTCGHCARTITNAVREIDPAAEVDIDLASRTVAVTSAAQPERLKTAIENAGYDVTAEAA